MSVSPLPPVIAVDGPSGVGKGMVTRWLATRTGWHRLDSGAIYRGLAIAARARGIDAGDEAALAALASRLAIEFRGSTEDDETILVDGDDATAAIRDEATGSLASKISVFPEVRTALLQRQRDFRRAPGLVADGRDMGTIVFPEAPLKIFLDAAPKARAERRFRQLGGEKLSKEEAARRLHALCEEIRLRDERDRSRATAPLKPAPDALIVDTTGMKPAEVTAEIERHLHARNIV